MKISREESELLSILEAYEKLINEPFSYNPGMMFFREEEQRKSHAEGVAFFKAGFDKTACSLGVLRFERYKMRMAKLQRQSVEHAVPLVTSRGNC
jgi:hypothetical protein